MDHETFAGFFGTINSHPWSGSLCADGLLIGSTQPGEAMSKQTGWLDNHASVAVNRDPRDGIIDVFAEDDYVLRIGWYRVDDGEVEMIVGGMK